MIFKNHKFLIFLPEGSLLDSEGIPSAITAFYMCFTFTLRHMAERL